MMSALGSEGGARQGEGLKDIDAYNKMHEDASADGRNSNYKDLVNSYYNLATDFYEYGWGQSYAAAPAAREPTSS